MKDEHVYLGHILDALNDIEEYAVMCGVHTMQSFPLSTSSMPNRPVR